MPSRGRGRTRSHGEGVVLRFRVRFPSEWEEEPLLLAFFVHPPDGAFVLADGDKRVDARARSHYALVRRRGASGVFSFQFSSRGSVNYDRPFVPHLLWWRVRVLVAFVHAFIAHVLPSTLLGKAHCAKLVVAPLGTEGVHPRQPR